MTAIPKQQRCVRVVELRDPQAAVAVVASEAVVPQGAVFLEEVFPQVALPAEEFAAAALVADLRRRVVANYRRRHLHSQLPRVHSTVHSRFA